MRDQYVRTGDGFLLVYDITSRSSFDEVAAMRSWLQRIKDTAHVPIVLCGNKCDLASERVVNSWEGRQLAESWGVPFFETSAKCVGERIDIVPGLLFAFPVVAGRDTVPPPSPSRIPSSSPSRIRINIEESIHSLVRTIPRTSKEYKRELVMRMGGCC